ncbi:TonB-dependent receptor [Rhizobiales bacterium RZME27]|uniref:TonB-dependent receptor n=1 Tax=Endobacterium cereale TaxID=2663029 RepID=A0A6A8AIY4_9HYPH|nr:TonB-dependent receptor [Endobacterium cereale]MEB2847346.1 TonB-dependent receptor [Endobacterium cereale]MQY49196.1 TonB-dependent receptor [Endobacterium cereale]
MALQEYGEQSRQSNRAKVVAIRLMASAATGIALVGYAPTALAQTTQRSFDIPAQPLASALNVYGRQSGLQVSLAASTSKGVTARSVSGNLSPQAALAQLLEGTGIPYSISNGTAVIGRDATTAGAVGGQDGTILAPIVVEGQSIGQSDIGETIIGSKQLERLNPSSIADVFREQAGVQVGSSLPMSQKVYVHGVEETNLAVSIDGARQNNKVFHHNATNLIDPSILKAVDVDSGIAPADAGPGALAGAINYETKDARDLLADGKSVGGFVTSTYNFNSDTVVTGLSAYGQKDGLDFLGYFTFGKGHEFHGGNGDVVQGTETDLLSGLGKVGYEFDSGDRFELSHDRLVDDAIRPFRANAGLVNSGKPWEPALRDYRMERQNTVFTYTDETSEGWWDPTFQLAYSSTEVTVPVFLRPPLTPSPYDAIGKTSSFNGKLENKFSFGLGNVVAGLDFYRDKASLSDYFEPGTERASNVGLYAQARIEPWERTRLSFGGRADHQWFTGVDDRDFSNSGLSANISGEYDLTDVLTAKAGFSRVWAGVPLAENFIINPGWNYGPDGPEPVTAKNYMIGLEAEYEGFTAEASLFRTDIADARVPVYGLAAGGALRNRDLRSEGFELGLGYDWGSGYVKVKYAHIDVDVDGLPANSDSGNYLASPVGDIITITAAHTFEQWNLTVGGDIEISPEYDHVVSGTEPYKAYEVVNVFTEWKPEQMQHFTFRAEVKNLFDESYSDRATYGQEFGNVTPLFEPGRSFLITAKATF